MANKALWLSFAVLALCFVDRLQCCQTIEQRFQFANSDVYIRLVHDRKLQYQLMKGAQTLQTVTFDNFKTSLQLQRSRSKFGYDLDAGDYKINFELLSTPSDDVVHLRVIRSNVPRHLHLIDCIDLNIPHTHWYGGPEDVKQYWPIERNTFENYSYVPKESRNAGVAERYWLNSEGTFYYVEEETPLFIEQNSMGYENKLCFSAQSILPYDTYTDTYSFTYHIGVGKNAKSAHMYAVKKLLGHPSAHPDERMVQYPIWSTWALYKTNIDDRVVRDFADQIQKYGFENSQLEIDDDWENCYGALTFRKSKFPNMKQLTDDLKAKGFRVTLWIHPFINKKCTIAYDEAKEKRFLVVDHKGNDETQWWNSGPKEAAYIDFTKSAAAQWFTQRLKRLQTEDGIDSFKFDAGETSWTPNDPALQGSNAITPLQIVKTYVRTVGAFGPMVEVRSGAGTQDLPVFVRMIDKDSEWKWNNGLLTLITTLLQMNMNGYPFVLPDMIGGNGYNTKPTKELFLRWLQANVFMPSLQFSYVPWYFDDETVEISKKFTQLHSEYTPQIMARFKLAVETGEPVNTPLWWADPEDNVAHSIYDQFLLGDSIISAPVVTEGAVRRDIYLPKGQWQDGNKKIIYTGPLWLMDYSAPLDTLPYFLRV